MKQVGIWIDKREAKIVSIENGKENLNTLNSQIEEFNPKGGSGTKLKGGPQDVVQDSKFLNREKHQYYDFFNRVVDHVKEADEIVVFGPAETGEKLHSELQRKHPDLYARTKPIEKADNLTDNQVKEWVRKFYG